LILEAGIAIADAVQSYLSLKEARIKKKGLEKLIPIEEKRLEIKRKKLVEEVDVLKAELTLKMDKQNEIKEFVQLCCEFYNDAVNIAERYRSEDIVDDTELDKLESDLEKQWTMFQRALIVYIESIN